MRVCIGIIIGLYIGYTWAWQSAHGTVARECSRLGGFYVADQTFTCSAREEQ